MKYYIYFFQRLLLLNLLSPMYLLAMSSNCEKNCYLNNPLCYDSSKNEEELKGEAACLYSHVDYAGQMSIWLQDKVTDRIFVNGNSTNAVIPTVLKQPIITLVKNLVEIMQERGDHLIDESYQESLSYRVNVTEAKQSLRDYLARGAFAISGFENQDSLLGWAVVSLHDKAVCWMGINVDLKDRFFPEASSAMNTLAHEFAHCMGFLHEARDEERAKNAMIRLFSAKVTDHWSKNYELDDDEDEDDEDKDETIELNSALTKSSSFSILIIALSSALSLTGLYSY